MAGVVRDRVAAWWITVLLLQASSFSATHPSEALNDPDDCTYRGDVSVSVAWVGIQVQQSIVSLPVDIGNLNNVSAVYKSATVATARDVCTAGLRCPPQELHTDDNHRNNGDDEYFSHDDHSLTRRENGLDIPGACTPRAVLECVVDLLNAVAAEIDAMPNPCRKAVDNDDDVHADHDDNAAPVYFVGSDALFAGRRRLPCEFEGSIPIPVTAGEAAPSLSSPPQQQQAPPPQSISGQHRPRDGSGVPLAITVPLSGALSRIHSFEQLHHHYLLNDFRAICDRYGNSTSAETTKQRQTNDEHECVWALIRALDDEIAERCPMRPQRPDGAAVVTVPRVSLEHSPVVHVRVSDDSDMQRFFHFFMAEALPVLSLARRMMDVPQSSSDEDHEDDDDNDDDTVSHRTRDGAGVERRHLVLHAVRRRWGSNPLHRALPDLFRAIAKAVRRCHEARHRRQRRHGRHRSSSSSSGSDRNEEDGDAETLLECGEGSVFGSLGALPPLLHFIDDDPADGDDGSSGHAAAAAAAVEVLLPRWDYAWWGADRSLAVEAAELAATAVAATVAPDHLADPDWDHRRRVLVFQLRSSTPELAAYYRRYYEELTAAGPVDFGNQDYRLYGQQRRTAVGLDIVAERWHRRTIETPPFGMHGIIDGDEDDSDPDLGSWEVRIVRGGDSLPMDQQAASYLGASVLVLGHGAGMVHAMWMMTMARTELTGQDHGHAPTVIEVGAEEDMSYDYLARICSAFGLRHVKIVCMSREEDVSLGETRSGAASEGHAQEGAGGGCAAALEAAIQAAMAAHSH